MRQPESAPSWVIGADIETMAQKLEGLGLIYPVSGGVQIDVTVAREEVPGGFRDSPFCDHNCRLETSGERTGNYNCPAAPTSHPGLKVKTMAPAELLIEAVKQTVQGIALANGSLRSEGLLAKYFTKFAIPPDVQPVIEQMLDRSPGEVNLFGGNPERHPQISEIITACRAGGFVVNLTTTAGRLMQDDRFLSALLNNPPNMLALSADDFGNVEQVGELAGLKMEEIRARWGKTPAFQGQKRKAYEAVYATKLAEGDARFPRILFNLVVHPGNVVFIEELITKLRQSFPGAIVNPYPAQSSFLHGEPVWKESHLGPLERFIDQRIAEHLKREPGIVRSLHYYLMLKAAFESFRENPEELTRMLSGYNVWKCYETPGAGRYVKVGASPEGIYQGDKIAGGHLSCFWDSVTIASPDQVWDMLPQTIAAYIMGDMKRLASQRKNACPGSIMPRLGFDMLSVELGMNGQIVPAYLRLRKSHVGF